MAEESVGKALNDAKVSYKDVQQAFVGYVYGQHFSTFQNFPRNSLDCSFLLQVIQHVVKGLFIKWD